MTAGTPPIPYTATLISNGYAPVLAEGKRPVAREWQSRKNTLEAFLAEVKEFPHAKNVGLRCGTLVGLDIDLVNSDHADAIKQLAFKMLGQSALIRVGKKGMVICYRNETPIKKIKIQGNGGAVEILGIGQQFIAFGDHPDTGKPYEWVIHDDVDVLDPISVALADLAAVTPEQLRSFAHAAAQLLENLGYTGAKVSITGEHTAMPSAVEEVDLKDNIERARQFLLKEKPAIEFQGSDEQTYRVACWLKDFGLSPETAFDLIWKYWVPRCEGQWTEDFVRLKINNAYEHGQNDVGAYAVTTSQETFGDAAKKLTDTHQAEEAEKSFIYIRDRETQLNSPPPEMQIETILPARKVIMVTGEKGNGKTYGALEIGTAIAMDRPAFGRFKILKPGPVVAFLGEDPREAEHSRLTAIEQHYGRTLQGLFFTVENAIPLDDPNLFEKYCDELRRLEKKVGKIACILNDTLKRSLGSRNPNDAESGMLFTTVNERLAAEFGCSIICNAHPPKNGGSEADIAGTGSFVDNVSVTLNMSCTSEKPFDIRCAFEPKYRIGPRPDPFIIRGMPVRLPSPVGGHQYDLVFTALSDDQVQRAADNAGAARGEREELLRALDARHAHTLATGLTTKMLAEMLAGDPARYKDDNDYQQAVGKHCNRLDHGTRSRKRGNKEYRPKYEAWFEKDHREGMKGAVKWFCPSPEERSAAFQETGAPCR